MPPQIEATTLGHENEKVNQSSSDDKIVNIFNTRKYLLTLLVLQWVYQFN